jgi:uncharacterized RDD family membrane protein YckC
VATYCNSCGYDLPARAPACPRCGAQTERGVAETARAQEAKQSPVYAAFWRRVAAALIDNLIVLAGVTIPLIIAAVLISDSGKQHSDNSEESALMGAFYLIYLFGGTVADWLYEALMESSRFEATWGKRALGILVVNMSG